ncbi:AAA family ATPase [Helicobacter ailurogastricus]|uniref:Chaperone protein ClpB n=1 Tax=Helicobacter ailurogastricus TaxID=1578720 RepID=A0A0K2Y2V1_9HELI|nr:AAA family ATPase [Helicobacter ailurogastricus]BDQ29783.1 chaperone [Helicobacter ailurogastricus]CRF52647.1 ATP-dependent Clp protease ATP-binding subunit ClpA [Helicobacter ailurogastricus]
MEKESEWLQQFVCDAKLRGVVILSGNVGDLFKSKFDKQYKDLDRFLIELLHQELGFSSVWLWDCVGGVDCDLSILPEAKAAPQPQAKDAYDIGEANTSQERPEHKSPEEFFSVIMNELAKKSGQCFILDYTDYIFGVQASLSEAERHWIVRLKKAIQRNAHYTLSGDQAMQSKNLVIFLARKRTALPSSFYINDCHISSLEIPLPSRPERKSFIEKFEELPFEPPITQDPSKLADFIDMLEGFMLKEIAQILQLAHNNKHLSPEKSVKFYRYKQSRSPWEDLDKHKLDGIHQALEKRVKGQSHAISKVEKVIIRAFTGFSGAAHSAKSQKPKGVLFFVGPTGVGKTELAKSLAEFLFGDESAFLRFDMSEFNHEQSDQRLVGAPPGYVGHEEGGQLTNAIRAKPFSVILFDEIEKAHGKILDKFLQILEDGRLTDGRGETASFGESVIIFTSNIGAADTDIDVDDDPKEVAQKFIQAVRDHFNKTLKRPELLNRIGNNIVPFHFIKNEDFLIAIIQSKFEKIAQQVAEKYKISLEFKTQKSAQEGFRALARNVNKEQGGRGVVNRLESQIENHLSIFIFDHWEEMEGCQKIYIKQTRPEFDSFEFELGPC